MDLQAIGLAFHEARSHPCVVHAVPPVVEGERAFIELDIDLRFPSQWSPSGTSPGGVLEVERVRLTFDAEFPMSAPEPSLREGFPFHRAHRARGSDGRIVPCVVDGDDAEFIAARGLYGYVGQIESWLQKAAAGQLLNAEFGWEPMLHPWANDDLIVDSTALRAKIDDNGGFAFFELVYAYSMVELGGASVPSVYGVLGPAKPPGKMKYLLQLDGDGTGGGGVGAGILVWPGPDKDGKPVIDDVYRVDDIKDQPSLMRLAEAFGVKARLQQALGLVERQAPKGKAALHEIPIILAARRPHRLQNTDSPIELCGYILRKSLPVGRDLGTPGQVRQLALREGMSGNLFRRMAGGLTASDTWVLAGCGSLGSKIALHRARSGHGPGLVADPAFLRPHNAARHALYPVRPAAGMGWHGAKATALAEALDGLKQPAKAIVGDQAALLAALAAEPAPAWLLNATASLRVRTALALGLAGQPRTVEVGLFDAGQLGYLTVEGASHNPNALELIGALNEHARGAPAVGRRLFNGKDNLKRVVVGEGCASVTMTVSDASLSVMAATMAEVFGELDAQAEAGSVHFLVRDGHALNHETLPVPAFERVELDGLVDWEVSLAAEVVEAMRAERARYPAVETGGVLIGSCYPLARRIVVTSLYPAPPDSRRTATQFDLGVEGLGSGLQALAETSAGHLVCVGTWHTHLGAADPSPMDRGTAFLVGLAEARPMAFAILGEDGLQAISAAAVIARKKKQPGKRRGKHG